ncbi:uncharacterized protein LOC126763120 [Bactrocera neohumeralis]|uniref:uncharacterized protein LOC120777166 n=1 Tax=Bactrocera tryoni TaxID=59916 RepID=UPI001A993561|nr:uncharacterized protein LOC120777166 [Bactrocera tryoni]XP_050336319.1 uncharacterized protein LOC126763120 [Bactrocera neohumeralis]
MTLEKVEQTKKSANSVSYQLDGNLNSFLNEGFSKEMKFKMNECNNNKTNVPMRSLDGKSQEENELKPVVVPIGSSVLSAAVDISKLANFGKTKRESGSLNLSRSFVSLDASNSVLPSRTILRRQRRLQSQDTEDKQEDSIERLNRLRARISGALSEVKGVLKYYSTDDSVESEKPKSKTDDALEKSETHPTETPIKNDSPVSFRFVKRIRRRSTFNEDDVVEVKKETGKEVTESINNDEIHSNLLLRKGEVIESDAIHVESVTSSIRSEIIHQNDNKPNEKSDFERLLFVNDVEQCTSKNIGDETDNSKHRNQFEFSRTGTNDSDIVDPALLEKLEQNRVNNEYPMDKILRKFDSSENKIPIEKTKNQQKSFAKSKSITRRASIAAVEGSHIDLPIKQATPIVVSIERRPSDSETVIKRKLKTSANFTSNVKEKITKVKRLPVNKRTLEINQYNKSSEISANPTEEIAVEKAATNATVPNTSNTLSTQLAITIAKDDASKRSAERPDDMKSEAMQPLSMTTNNSWPTTNFVDGDGVMVAALVNSLQTVEASSHTKHLETQPSNALIESIKVGKPVIEKVEKHSIGDIQIEIEITPTYCADTLQESTVDGNLPVDKNLKLLECAGHFKDTEQLAIKTEETDSVFSEQQPTQNVFIQLLSSPTVNMPELQVIPIPVKPLHVFAENNADKINSPTKDTTVNQTIRNISVDESSEVTKMNKSSNTKIEESEEGKIIDNRILGDILIENASCAGEENILNNAISITAECAFEEPVAPLQLKKSRKVKKKVIIKRQHRKLSVSENTFFKDTEQPDILPAATETLEKTIAYVTDDEDDIALHDVKSAMPIKSCMKAREFQVGDWVMYGERFRKTQIRWKKGQISERITSISYKINIDDKEVSAHINYIKKYTGRRVNFGGKEYLEIDYEQIAEEERRAHTYSIWNMV